MCCGFVCVCVCVCGGGGHRDERVISNWETLLETNKYVEQNREEQESFVKENNHSIGEIYQKDQVMASAAARTSSHFRSSVQMNFLVM
jgi:ribosomal protein L14E/L6E/L27E